jgi:hypothetical protein
MSTGDRPLRDRLRSNYTYLINELLSNYVNDLYQASVLSGREKDELFATTDTHRQAQRFVDTLMGKGEPAIQKFFDILRTRTSMQPHVYEALFPAGNMTSKLENVPTTRREDQRHHSGDASVNVFASPLEKMTDKGEKQASAGWTSSCRPDTSSSVSLHDQIMYGTLPAILWC